MEDKNIITNLTLQQMNQSDALGFNTEFISQSHDSNFDLLGKAFQNTGRIYARLKMAVDNGNCVSENCVYELNQLKRLQEAPQASLDFISSLLSQLEITESSNFDPNNSYEYTVANCIFKNKPGFSKTDGYNIYLNLLEDSSQEIIFEGPMFTKELPHPLDPSYMVRVENPLIINSVALESLSESGTTIVSETPDINKEMLALLPEVGLFTAESMMEGGQLSPTAIISEEFVLKNPDGSFDYEIIDLGNGKGRNVLKYDMNKIESKTNPFINAEVAGLLSDEQSAVAAWNVYISKGTSVEEDDQMVQSANAGDDSWSYKTDLPLQQPHKKLFEIKYKQYFVENYLKQFITNQLPTVKEDAAVFDLAEAKKAKAQKFLDDNDLN